MKIEDQVCFLEQAKRLNELGVNQESLIYWWHKWEGNSDDDAGKNILTLTQHSNTIPVASAFTVAELGQMLPDIIASEHLYSYQQARNWSDTRLPKHRLVYWFSNDIELHRVDAETEADARAKMLIYLLENQLLTLENVEGGV
jgi:hypothetical protein